jgi:flagellin-like hook-associated protein FlgL
MAIAHNLNAIGVQRTLNQSNASLSGSLEKLSTGYKINKGADDPSGLVISELLRSQTNGIARAIQNTQEANNVLGIAEGALNEMNNILTKMRQLAIHAANDGITSSDQIAADQAEVDSSIQTLDRIARTTTFSNENLLNGNKQINYDTSVLVKDSKDMPLIDKGLTSVLQIFKRQDFQLNINFSGKNADGTDNQNSAKKAYFEITAQTPGAEATQVYGYTGSGTDGVAAYDAYSLTKDQAFTLTGNNGSRYLTFAKGTHLGEMATAINSVKDSTGVKANLIFDSGVMAHEAFAITDGVKVSADASNADTAAVEAGKAFLAAVDSDGSAIRAFNADRDGNILGAGVGVNVIDISSVGTAGSYYNTGSGEVISESMFKSLAGGQTDGFEAVTQFQIGTNLDGNGRMYLKMVTDNKYEIYKDAAMSMKVGSGDIQSSGGDSVVSAVNNSGIANMQLTFGEDMSKFKAGSTTVLQLGSMALDTNATDGASSGADSVNFQGLAYALGTAAGDVNVNNSYFSGVQLGYNTSETGQLYIKAEISTVGQSSQIWVYRDAQMRDQDLVARSDKFNVKDVVGPQSVSIFAERIGDTPLTTGLYGVINIGDCSSLANGFNIESAIVKFENLGLRISAAEYGADQFVKINASQGAVWTRYDSDNKPHVVDAGVSGAEWTTYGSNAVLALNGQRVELNGIAGTLTNLDSTADIAFNAGEVGNTTLASAGYTDGSLATKAAVFGNTRNQEVNALHSTTEMIKNFTGGMQFQLGEGAGDQNRTIYSIKDITAPFLGKMNFYDYFGNNFPSNKYLAIQDMMSGGQASLAVDSVKAMAIVTKAIEDVSSLRANIGAFQANMLETNANNLQVAFQKITETESYIRDTDMATESTKFTKNQVLVQAGTSMLAQANQLPQSALSLIGG